MQLRADVVWWKRLLSGFGALLFTLLAATALLTIRDFWHTPGLQWGNGGEVQVAGYFLDHWRGHASYYLRCLCRSSGPALAGEGAAKILVRYALRFHALASSV